MSDEMLPVEAELTLLRPKIPKKRRRHARQRCSLATMAKLALGKSAETRVAWVYNLALGGVGLNATQSLDVGQELLINFRTAGKPVPPQLAKVIFCQQEADQSWRVGCEFATPISDEILETLLS